MAQRPCNERVDNNAGYTERFSTSEGQGRFTYELNCRFQREGCIDEILHVTAVPFQNQYLGSDGIIR